MYFTHNYKFVQRVFDKVCVCVMLVDCCRVDAFWFTSSVLGLKTMAKQVFDLAQNQNGL